MLPSSTLWSRTAFLHWCVFGTLAWAIFVHVPGGTWYGMFGLMCWATLTSRTLVRAPATVWKWAGLAMLISGLVVMLDELIGAPEHRSVVTDALPGGVVSAWAIWLALIAAAAWSAVGPSARRLNAT